VAPIFCTALNNAEAHGGVLLALNNGRRSKVSRTDVKYIEARSSISAALARYQKKAAFKFQPVQRPVNGSL